MRCPRMKPVITVVSLGPGDPGLLTLQTADALRNAKQLILRTEQHGVAQWLKEQSIPYTTMDALYDEYWDFDELHAAIAKKLWCSAQTAPVTYAVMDATTDGSVAALAASMPEDGKLVRLAGLSLADAYLSALPEGQVQASGIRVIPAMD